jgi:predicted nucleic acid-binding protein
MARVLVDTNILVYFYDYNSPEKQKCAREVISRLVQSKIGCLSVQSLAEFVTATMWKLTPHFSASEALTEASQLAVTFQVLDLTQHIVLEAARGVRDHQLAYYDAQIWAAARLNQVSIIFSEDFQDGQTLENVRFANPFSSEFHLDNWIS